MNRKVQIVNILFTRGIWEVMLIQRQSASNTQQQHNKYIVDGLHIYNSFGHTNFLYESVSYMKKLVTNPTSNPIQVY